MATDPRPEPPAYQAVGKYAGFGLQFALSILFFLWIGQWVDRKVGTDGIFVIIGVFIGAGGAFYSMYRSVMADQKREDDEKATRAAGRSREEPK
jgi:ATP synthase protein I